MRFLPGLPLRRPRGRGKIAEITRFPAVLARKLEKSGPALRNDRYATPSYLLCGHSPPAGAEAVGSLAAEFAEFLQREVTRWTEVARKVGLKPESSRSNRVFQSHIPYY